MNSGPYKILLVDDDRFFLTLMAHVFKKAGFDCYEALSAAEAITLLDRHDPPNIILSDYDMGDMNGLQFRSFLMQDEVFRDIPFVFLTFFSDSDLMTKGLDLQAIDYIIKNTPVNVIVSKVTNILLTVDKQRELSELEIKKAANSLNIKSIPTNSPLVAGFTINYWHRAYKEIPGGDFIDFIPVDEQYTFIVLGDVMGKKWKAWFFTFGFLSYIRSAIRYAAFNGEYATAKILQQVNKVICYDDVLKDIFSSLSLLLIDSHTGRISYSGAGDLPLLLYKAEESKVITISSSGLLLGLMPDGLYSEQEIILSKGDKLFTFTDGIIDFADANGKKSDYNGFALQLQHWMNMGDRFEGIKRHLEQKKDGHQIDDQSIISIYKNKG